MKILEAIDTAVRGRDLAPALVEAAFGEIVAGDATPAQIAALLVALRAKGESVDEIVAATRAVRASGETAVAADPRTLDNCGTGGSGLETFSISTTASFVIAGAGVPVAKHGNRAASRQTGSFDVLEALGVAIELPVAASAAILAEIGIGTVFAQKALPAMRHAAPVRREIRIRTIMNCMGPLLNPLRVKFQYLGCYADVLVEPLARALGALGSERVLVVHGSDGLDDLTTTGPSRAALLSKGHVEVFDVTPESLGLHRATAADLAGGKPAENAEILRAVLAGETGPRRDIVCLNAGAALFAAGAVDSIAEGIPRAEASIDSGAAREKLDRLVDATQAAAARLARAEGGA